jgi:hypothetical protein
VSPFGEKVQEPASYLAALHALHTGIVRS